MDTYWKEIIGLLTLLVGGLTVLKITRKRKSGDVKQEGNIVNNGDIAGGDIYKDGKN